MPAILRDLGQWFWRLVPANPILVRVVLAGGRRERHALIRALYVAIFAAVVVIGVIIMRTGDNVSLTGLAKSASGVFGWVALLQVGLVCLLAPIFAAAAITQEKDSQTYSILMSTPLTNAQIVLGSLLSRLYFVIALLISGLPLVCITMVYGGVTGSEIGLTFLLAASTATITASIAIAISVIKVGTGRTIFTFYLMIALYLALLGALSTVPTFIPPEAEPGPGGGGRLSWLAAFHPFLALNAALNVTPAPDIVQVSHYGFPRAQWLAYPHYSFIVMSLGISVLLVAASVGFARRGAKVGEPTWFGRLFQRERSGGGAGEVLRKPRHVWANPVAWREAETKAAAGSGGTVRAVLLFIGLAGAVALLIAHATGTAPAMIRLWLKGLVSVEIGLSMFIATATAATSMTREKEGNTLDLLLATPLQSSQIISGKIRGLVTFAAPMLAVPGITLLLFIAWDFVTGAYRRGTAILNPESVLLLPMIVAGFTVFSCAIGLKWSIAAKKTLVAVLLSVGVVMLVFGGVYVCAVQALSAVPIVSTILATLSPLSSVLSMLDPQDFLTAGLQTPSRSDLAAHRIAAAASCVISSLIYFLISLSIHRAMVRTFDMTIRKQSA